MINRRKFLQDSLKGIGALAVIGAGGTIMNSALGNPLQVFGAKATGERLLKMKQSPHYKDGKFWNISPTPDLTEGYGYWDILKMYNQKIPLKAPAAPLPIFKPDYNKQVKSPEITWLGHSSYVLRLPDFTIVVDPVFHKASPFQWVGPGPYSGPDSFGLNSLPAEIDLLLISHDHYDHLDYLTIKQLHPRVKQIVTSLGVGAHLELWGVPAGKITELDWWETTNLKTDLTITATPARHFSGRGLNRNETFWSSFVLKTKTETLFLGGDSGYDTHFAEIGKKYGPFDYAILENGQYNKAWQAIHTLPEETAQAATDLGAKKLLPVHWSKFTLALHPWFEPMEALIQAAEKHSYEIVNPRLGETSVLKDLDLQTWWK